MTKKKKITVLSGAGISAESGISTFRDSDGLWENYPVQDVASIEGFHRNPQLVLDFYNARREAYKGCNPNPAHIGVAEWEQDFEVTVVTQNIDNLHERAGSSHVIHLHGELLKNRSVRDPYTTYDVDLDAPPLKVGDLAPDGSQLRPFIVWFGEAVPMMERAIQEAADADIFVVIGTSLNVYPAAGLLHYLKPTAELYVIDPQTVAIDSRLSATFIPMKASQGVKHLTSLLKNNP